MPGQFRPGACSGCAELVIRFGQAPSPSFGNPHPQSSQPPEAPAAEPGALPHISPCPPSNRRSHRPRREEIWRQHPTTRSTPSLIRFSSVGCLPHRSKQEAWVVVRRDLAASGTRRAAPLVNWNGSKVLPVESGDTLASRCRFYREICGLPARVQPELHQIFISSGRVGAITVPAKLGVAVKGHMQSRRVQLGPIVSHPRSKRWTFLVVPDLPDDNLALFGELFRLNASVARVGARIALPSPIGRHRFRIWVQPPRNSYRPSGRAVVEAIRACARPRPRGSR